jgi:uncharacterized protein (TIGR00251 family)
MQCISQLADGTVAVRLHVQPRASITRIAGLHDGCLKIAVASPPVDGKANKEIIRFLGKILNMAKADIVVKSGTHSRRKTVVLKNSSASLVRNVFEGLLSRL